MIDPSSRLVVRESMAGRCGLINLCREVVIGCIEDYHRAFRHRMPLKRYKDQEDEICDKAMQSYMLLAMESI